VQNDRVGQLILAILTGCAVACVGTTILEVGMIASARRAAERISLYRGVVIVVAAAAGISWVLGAYGLAGAGGTDGSVDLLWSASAVAAAGLGLVLPLGGEHARAAAVVAVAAGLTKDAGIVAASLLFAIIGARWLLASTRRRGPLNVRISRRRGLLAAIACAIGVAGVVAWPIGATVRRATSDYDLSGPRSGSLLSRTESTWDALTADLHLAGLALAIGVVAALVFRRSRRSMGLGSDGWLWAFGVAEVLCVGLVYIGGSRPIGNWLSTTSDQETLFAESLGLALVAWWCVVGTVAALGRPEASPAKTGTDPARTGPRVADVDANGPAVLHPGT
jgi:hypothetical protein